MCAAAVESLDALLLIHAKGRTEQASVVEVVDVGNAHATIQELVHVATEVHLAAVLQRGDGDALQLLDGNVDVEPVVSVIDVAVVVDFIYLIIWAAGIVHQHDVVLVEVLASVDAVSLEELLRRVAAALISELCRRHAVSHHEHPIDGAELLHFECLELLLAHACLALLAEGDAELAEPPLHVLAELAGAVADVGLGHHVGRHNAVLRGEVGNAGIGAAVGDRVLEEPAHYLAVDGLLPCIDNALQEEVALLQLVIEEEVALAEDEVLRTELLHSAASQHVQSRKEPAASTALLVGDACVLHLDAEVLVLRSGVLLVDGHLLEADVADGVAKRLLGGSSRVTALKLLEHIRRDVCLCVHHRTR